MSDPATVASVLNTIVPNAAALQPQINAVANSYGGNTSTPASPSSSPTTSVNVPSALSPVVTPTHGGIIGAINSTNLPQSVPSGAHGVGSASGGAAAAPASVGTSNGDVSQFSPVT